MEGSVLLTSSGGKFLSSTEFSFYIL